MCHRKRERREMRKIYLESDKNSGILFCLLFHHLLTQQTEFFIRSAASAFVAVVQLLLLFSCLFFFFSFIFISWRLITSQRCSGFCHTLTWISHGVTCYSVVVQLIVTPWTAACQASLSFTISWTLLKHMSTELVMPSNHIILCCPLLLP